MYAYMYYVIRFVCIYMRTNLNACMHSAHIPTCIIHTYIHICIHINTYKYMRIYKYVSVSVCAKERQGISQVYTTMYCVYSIVKRIF